MVHAPICSVLFEFFHFDGRAHDGFSTSAHETVVPRPRLQDQGVRREVPEVYRAYAILCCLIYVVVIPLLFFIALLAKKGFDGYFDTGCISFLLRQVDGLVKRLRREANDKPADGAAPSGDGDSTDDSGNSKLDAVTPARCPKPLLALWVTLVGPYKEVAWFTEPLSMVVRTSLSGFLLICLPQAKRMRIVLSFGIALIYALLVSDFKPFKSAAVNMVASTFWFFVTSVLLRALRDAAEESRAISSYWLSDDTCHVAPLRSSNSDLCRKIKQGNRGSIANPKLLALVEACVSGSEQRSRAP